MSKDRMTQETREIIRIAVDRAVQRTGYPVTGAVLKSINVTRSQAKKLVREGLLVSIDMAVSGQVIKGYYVNGGVYPAKLARYEAAQAKQAASEATEQPTE